ncbi:MAG: acyltransferase, partial [Solirubrobacteraceae bacterium]
MTGARLAAGATLGAYRLWRRARDKAFSVVSSRAFASFGARSVIELPVRLSGERRIAIGDDVFVGAGSWLQVIGPPADEVALRVGDGTSISGHCVLSATSSLTIGRRVLIARGVYVADHGHAYRDTNTAVLDQGLDPV